VHELEYERNNRNNMHGATEKKMNTLWLDVRGTADHFPGGERFIYPVERTDGD